MMRNTRSVAESLGEIDPGNPEAIAALIAILSLLMMKIPVGIVADSLGKIDPGNPEAIAALIAFSPLLMIRIPVGRLLTVWMKIGQETQRRSLL
jgi:hypothetical protein